MAPELTSLWALKTRPLLSRPSTAPLLWQLSPDSHLRLHTQAIMSKLETAMGLLMAVFDQYAGAEGDKGTLTNSEMKTLLQKELPGLIQVTLGPGWAISCFVFRVSPPAPQSDVIITLKVYKIESVFPTVRRRRRTRATWTR